MFKDAEKIPAMKTALQDIEAFFKKQMKGADYLSGRPDPMMIDIHIYPLVERIVLLEDSIWKHGFDAIGVKDCPLVYAYVHRFRNHPKMAPHVMP